MGFKKKGKLLLADYSSPDSINLECPQTSVSEDFRIDFEIRLLHTQVENLKVSLVLF